MDAVERLHRSIEEPLPTQAVCSLILQTAGDGMTAVQRRVLHREASVPATAAPAGDIALPPAALHKVRALLDVFGKTVSDDTIQRMADDPWNLAGQLMFLAPFIGWMGGDFTKATRLNRQQRAQLGLGWSKQKYNKLVRQMRRTQTHAFALQRQILQRQMCLVARTGLAYSITVDEMRADPAAAAFVAYYVARRHQAGGRFPHVEHNPLGVTEQMLLTRCHDRGVNTDWWMIARSWPAPMPVAWLDDGLRGQLMGRWMGFMRLAAGRLRELHDGWPGGGLDRELMRARTGEPWSTWNTVARCYNAARAGWLDCLTAVGTQRMLSVMCPGRAVPLTGGQAGTAQTRLWAALPPPWDVLDGRVPCTARDVMLAAAHEGVVPHTDGWLTITAAVLETGGAPVTPLLAQGIQDSDPDWAKALVGAGMFGHLPQEVGS